MSTKNSGLVVQQGDDVVNAPKKNRRMPISKDDAITAISHESAVIRDAALALNKMHEMITRTVSNQVDLNFSLKDEARVFLEVLEDAEKSTKKILQVVIARCRARLEE